ncbi:RNA polymerase sigma factor [Phaeodactylibacter luteus]|uniref:Sigma-70 family RNA polymerase sigma factor n=1 Tax=Phaeodactylibacter luteus TaxID=1564516 RepID=A0A5C6S708_9BACT|nr:sigma-70 family RNA polymerase sigma factor [Phaeodactylibacter luteus]TXB70205.1 sigma-70 family RNA polymerase sigma factor [Phaeodactylibacter luteus]
MSEPKRTVSAEAMQEEWLEVQAAQADPAMFEPLYERYYEAIFLYVFRRTTDQALSADLCSQVFLKALQQLPRYQFRGVPFSAWLYRIAANEIAQHFRRNRRRQIVTLEEEASAHLADELGGLPAPDLMPALVAALDTLKPDDLHLIELRFFEGLPFREIAAILDITENNAKVKAFRILNRLKKKIAAS